MNSPSDRLIFESPYEMIEYLTRMIGHAQSNTYTSQRLSDAHEYVHKYCMAEGWGKNVWHTILDDAIKMRKYIEDEKTKRQS